VIETRILQVGEKVEQWVNRGRLGEVEGNKERREQGEIGDRR
jgi:hypothetical protein